MLILARLKSAGAVNFRARYLADHRRSKPYDPLSTLARGRRNPSPVCPPRVAERAFGVLPPQRLSPYTPSKRKHTRVRDEGGERGSSSLPSPSGRRVGDEGPRGAGG